MANLVTELPAASAIPLIDGHFTVDFNTPAAEFGAGQPAFSARSARHGAGFMAVQVARGWPARSRLLTGLAGVAIANVAVPVGHGTAELPSGDTGYFVVCPAPPGRSLAVDLRAWSEQELIDTLLRPVAVALVDLHGRDGTHRAIRLENAFRSGPADPVTLGCAWAAPPASRQPCVYEPPYSAMCLPAGRGDGAPADDIYALGVLLVILALGRDPMAGMSDAAIIRAKLEQGSAAAVIGRNRLPTSIAELARGMLADDPEHRPSAMLLCDLAAARARRPAARPQRRGQRPFALGEPAVWTARELSLAIVADPQTASGQLRNGAMALWLRRSVGDGGMASRIDEVCSLRDSASLAEESRADALLAARAVAVLDPLAPLCWRRVAIWPDGLGAALNQALQTDPAQALAIAEVAGAEIAVAVSAMRPERSDLAALRNNARQFKSCLAVRQSDLGALRLSYALNPLAPCESPLLAGQWVTRIAELLPALEKAAAGSTRAKLPPVDRHLLAFIGVRRDERTQGDLGQLCNLVAPADPMSQLRLLARLQQHAHPEQLPALTAWMAEIVAPAAAGFRGQTQRVQIAAQLAELSKGGHLPALVALLDDQARQVSDKDGYGQAVARSGEIDAELKAMEASISPRRLTAARTAQDISSGISLAVCALALAAAVFL